jgi:hypothetical protein
MSQGRKVRTVAITEGRNDNRIDPDRAECRLHRKAIGGMAEEALTDQRIRHRRKRRRGIDPSDDVLQISER